MTDVVYTRAKAKLLSGDLDLNSSDMRIVLCMTNTTADTDIDAEFVDDITDLDEFDGANYVRKALASETVTADLANDRGEFDAEDISWTTLGAGTRQAAGMLLIQHVTNDSDSVPVAWIDSGGFPIAANGGNLNVAWNAEGILQAVTCP